MVLIDGLQWITGGGERTKKDSDESVIVHFHTAITLARFMVCQPCKTSPATD